MRLAPFPLESKTETAMRKLKQATQREKTRRALREQKEADATSRDRSASKPMKASARSGASVPRRAAEKAGSPSHKATLH